MSNNKEYMDNIIDEAEDTLSLSDLVTSYNAIEWADYFSRESQSSSSISSSMDQELQDEYFEFFSEEWSTTIPSENIIFCGKLIPSKNPLIIKNKTQLPNKKSSTTLVKTYSKQKTSSSSSKSKWDTLLGTARILTGGMVLKDVKTRQSRQSPSLSPLIESYNRSQQEVENVYRRRSRGLRGVIRAFGCGDYFHATNTKESIKSIPRV